MKIIKVKNKHIKNGGCFIDTCPVALAIKYAGYGGVVSHLIWDQVCPSSTLGSQTNF